MEIAGIERFWNIGLKAHFGFSTLFQSSAESSIAVIHERKSDGSFFRSV
ncbi:hypothetical protein [Yoonia sp. MH D7]